jgi:flagellar motor switch protein FliG
MEEKNKEQGIFINGKGQVIKMLQYLSQEEKQKLLANIRLRNPSLANELNQESISFNDFVRASDQLIIRVLSRINSTIMGVALKASDEAFQRKVLSLATRSYAEEAYDVLLRPLNNEEIAIRKTRTKIVEALIGIAKGSTGPN